MKLEFETEFLSDYHLGSGTGDSETDSLLMRDGRGALSIPGTTISGMLRQALWDLHRLPPLESFQKCSRSGRIQGTSYCSGSTNDPCMVCRILGTAEMKKPWVFSSAAISDNSSNTSTEQITRSSIDHRTRTSQDKKLFTSEVGPRASRFSFTVENIDSSKEQLVEAAFIVAGLRFVRSIGSSKRRGKGQCRIRLIEADIIPDEPGENIQSWFIDQFKRVIDNQDISPFETTQRESVLRVENSEYTVALELREPVLVTCNLGSGNTYSGLDYVPGSTVRGALAWRAIKRGILDEDYELFANLFNHGALRLSNFYPAISTTGKPKNRSAIPIPMDVRYCEFHENKHKRRFWKINDKRLAEESSEPCSECEDKDSKMEKREGFAGPNCRRLVLDNSINTHIAIIPSEGMVERGALFRYEPIPVGTQMLGILAVDQSVFTEFLEFLAPDIKHKGSRLEMDIRLGKGTSRGYGLVHMTLIPAEHSIDVFHWRPIEERVISVQQPIIMTFLSDTILIDDYGRYLDSLNSEHLTELLGCKATITRKVVRTHLVERFDTNVGLPRWREMAISAGSVLEFTVKDIDLEELQYILSKIEKEFLGHRTNEGLGMVSFNHPIRSLDGLEEIHEESENNDSLLDSELDKKVDRLEEEVDKIDKKHQKKLAAIARRFWTDSFTIEELNDCRETKEEAKGRRHEGEETAEEQFDECIDRIIEVLDSASGFERRSLSMKIANALMRVWKGGGA